MKNLKLFLTKHPVLSAISLTIVWFALGIFFMGIASAILKRGFGDTITVIIGLSVALAFILWLTWKLDWLKAAGITASGNYKVWLLALAGIIYFVPASLYSFFGNPSWAQTSSDSLENKVILYRNLSIVPRGRITFIPSSDSR